EEEKGKKDQGKNDPGHYETRCRRTRRQARSRYGTPRGGPTPDNATRPHATFFPPPSRGRPDFAVVPSDTPCTSLPPTPTHSQPNRKPLGCCAAREQTHRRGCTDSGIVIVGMLSVRFFSAPRISSPLLPPRGALPLRLRRQLHPAHWQ